MQKLLISGGHLTPALALIDYLQSEEVTLEIIFAGRLFSQKKNKQESQEKEEISKRKIKFVAFDAPRPPTNFAQKITFVLNLKIAFCKALWLMIKFRPKVFLSFGGYLAVPLGIAAWTLGIPVVTHEQTKTAGQANKFLAKFAKKIAISYPETEKLFPKKKTILTGNPIRPDLLSTRPQRPDWSKGFSKSKPTLLMTGGNQGSYIINTTVAQIIPKVINSWNVIHACGNPTQKINYKNELDKIKKKLNATNRKSYVIKEWLTTPELAWIYNTADGIISRAGANTIQEIAFAQIPAILIPLPFSKGKEQLLNAKSLTDSGAAILLEQKKLNADSLLEKIIYLKKHQKSLKRKLEPLKPQLSGARKLWEIINALL